MFSGSATERSGAKKGIDIAAAARRRQGQTISLRDKNRKSTLNSKRAKGTLAETFSALPEDSMNPLAYPENIEDSVIPVEIIPNLCQGIQTGDAPVKLQCLKLAKKLAGRDKPAAEPLINSGITSFLVSILDMDGEPAHQFEALCTLGSLAGCQREHIAHIVRLECVPRFVRLLQSPDPRYKEQCALAIGTIAAEGSAMRDLVWNAGAFQGLLQAMQNCEAIEALQNIAYAMACICRHKPFPPLSATGAAIPFLCSLMSHHVTEVIIEALWALSFITDGDDRIDFAMQFGMLPRVVELLRHESPEIKIPAVRIVSNFAQGSDAATDYVVKSGALLLAPELLSHTSGKVRKETCWMLSHLSAGPLDQIQYLVDNGLLAAAVPCLSANEFFVKKEAMWIFANICEVGSLNHVGHILSVGFLDPFCLLLQVHDLKVLQTVLQALSRLLEHGSDFGTMQGEDNPILPMLKKNGALDEIERLTTHTNSKVNHFVESILEMVYADEQEEWMGEDFGAAAVGQFNFNQEN